MPGEQDELRNRPRAFLITPLSAATADEDEATYQEVRAALDAAAAKASVELLTSADIFEAGVVIEQIKREISSANVVIAVCTGRNANVFYELGLAETRGFLPILVAPSKDHLPFDVQHWRSVMYEGEAALLALADTVARFITTALDAQVEGGPTEAAGPTDDFKRLLLTGDKRAFRFRLKEAIRDATQQLDEAAFKHWDDQDDQGYEALAPARHDAAATVLRLLSPVIEIEPEWLPEALGYVTSAGAESVRFPGKGASPWTAIRSSWQYLILRTLAAAAILDRQPAALSTLLLSLNAPEDSDHYPLMMSNRFTWPKSYAGNAWLAFQDFLGLLESHPDLLSGLGTARRTPTEIACGADVVTGLARCVREDRDGESARGTLPDRRPHCYAAFAQFEPWEGVWAARLLLSNEDLARATGASSVTHLADVARRWFPRLVSRKDTGVLRYLGLQWDEYLGYE